MKSIACHSLLVLLFACASPDGFRNEEVRTCESGQEVSVTATLNMPHVGQESAVDDRLTATVDVANNSHAEITVKYIRVRQTSGDDPSYTLDGGYRAFNRPIAPGDDVVFEIPVLGRQVISRDERAATHRGEDGVVLVVDVGLSNGVTYRCRFSVPVPL